MNYKIVLRLQYEDNLYSYSIRNYGKSLFMKHFQ